MKARIDNMINNNWPSSHSGSTVKRTASWSDTSSQISSTPIPASFNPRDYYLSLKEGGTELVLCSSNFIPHHMITYLMKEKKDSAVSVKYQGGDAITNMEAAFHHFLTPFVPILMHGDYHFNGGHGVEDFGLDREGKQRARTVILSGLVQMDFETYDVMFQLTRLGQEAMPGQALCKGFSIPTTYMKTDPSFRRGYDIRLKMHAVHHLTREGMLPGTNNLPAGSKVLSMEQSITHISNLIQGRTTSHELENCFVQSHGALLSLEMILSTSTHQSLNEFRALETKIRPDQGYIYTWDPASIFANKLSPTLLNRIVILGIKMVLNVHGMKLKSMGAFGFNDYADPAAVNLLKTVFRDSAARHVSIYPKSHLFPAPNYLYRCPNGLAGDATKSLLVIHNNSDGFGQNIETEGPGGSLDGAVGWNSSAAAGLKRERDWSKVELI
jgi:hypothetical protein